MTWPIGYACAPVLEARAGRYALRPIHWDDREPIRQWRNQQLDVLRQDLPLSVVDQEAYFSNVVRPQLGSAAPDQILFGFTEDSLLVGYGGIVHISWEDRRGEISFLTAPDRLESERFTSDWFEYLRLVIPICRDPLQLHKLTTETYAFRDVMPPILERAGFHLEGTLRDQHLVKGRWTSSLAHGLIL